MNQDLAKGIAVGVGAAAAISAAYMYFFHPSCKQPKNVYVLRVDITLDPAKGGLKTFLEGWKDLAKFCYESEPNTLSYELCYGEENPNQIQIYERYVCKDDLTVTHHASAAFKKFGATMAEKYPGLIMTKERATFFESNVGYMSK